MDHIIWLLSLQPVDSGRAWRALGLATGHSGAGPRYRTHFKLNSRASPSTANPNWLKVNLLFDWFNRGLIPFWWKVYHLIYARISTTGRLTVLPVFINSFNGKSFTCKTSILYQIERHWIIVIFSCATVDVKIAIDKTNFFEFNFGSFKVRE